MHANRKLAAIDLILIGNKSGRARHLMCDNAPPRLRRANKSVPYSRAGHFIERPFWEDTEMATDNTELQPSKDNGAKENGAVASSHAATEAAARLAHDFVDRVAKLAEESEVRIRNATLNAEHSLKESIDTARTRGLAAKESVGDLVQRHPWAAVGIAFGVGVLLSTLARRSDRID
jgi:ElaB/YqjD/DUF883 family membrane-anchored ribosome-binding protein